jgi:hypothetical protein
MSPRSAILVAWSCGAGRRLLRALSPTAAIPGDESHDASRLPQWGWATTQPILVAAPDDPYRIVPRSRSPTLAITGAFPPEGTPTMQSCSRLPWEA